MTEEPLELESLDDEPADSVSSVNAPLNEPISAAPPVEFVVSAEEANSRLDWLLARRLPAFSRTHLRRAINAVGVLVNGRRAKASHHVQEGERITLQLPELPRTGPIPEEIALDVIYEDDWLAVVNKPPGMVVHPARGHWSGTLASALQFRFENLSAVGGPARPGIVHRLDRDTSGVILVAKSDVAHSRLAEQFERRTVEKTYFAIVVGQPNMDRDRIDRPIGIHPHAREKMAIRENHPTSRPAISVYEVAERFRGFAAVRVSPKTGRTHQIRVHLASIGCPVLCDRAYGHRARLTLGELRGDASDETLLLDRQALHAERIHFRHPNDGRDMTLTAELPDDMRRTLAALSEHRRL